MGDNSRSIDFMESICGVINVVLSPPSHQFLQTTRKVLIRFLGETHANRLVTNYAF